MNYAHQLPFYFSQVPTRELVSIGSAIHGVYIFQDNRFRLLFPPDKVIPIEKIKKALSLGILEVFVHQEDYDRIQAQFITKLRKNAASLSFGDGKKNATKQANLMSINLSNLYKNPHDDELLTILFQSSSNFMSFLKDNKKMIPSIYHELQKYRFHFTFVQPMLSSLMLLGFSTYIHSFNDRDLENLFIASYFKDLGMSYLPIESHNKFSLADSEKNAIKSHPENSAVLLDGRVPLTSNFLEVINNHHFHNDIIHDIKTGKKVNLKHRHFIGIETVIVSVTDMIVAMTSKRPYRENYSLFATLDIIKQFMAEQYPPEFRALVNYLRYFYSQIEKGK
jgi:hypothetical protein